MNKQIAMEVATNALKAFIWGSVAELSIDLGVNTYRQYKEEKETIKDWWKSHTKTLYDETHGENKNKSIGSKIGDAFKFSVNFTFNLLRKPFTKTADAVGVGGFVDTVLAVIPAAIESTFMDFEWILLGGVSSAILSYPMDGVFLAGVVGGGGAFGTKELLSLYKK